MPGPFRTTRIVLAALALGSCATAFAGQEMLSIDSKFRARIAKEKIKAAAEQRKAREQQNPGGQQAQGQSGCGSQSIGNVDSGGRIGAAPREVFVFAPNAINVVGNGGCR